MTTEEIFKDIRETLDNYFEEDHHEYTSDDLYYVDGLLDDIERLLSNGWD
jgi:hypothetical protein